MELNGVPKGTINHNSVIDINGSPSGNEVIITLGSVTSLMPLKTSRHGHTNLTVMWIRYLVMIR
ncbi:MAG: hypothetical protein H6551_01280 [Chitinophagales bacterium]|nr:hypothetical protein [Chitinophagales bacterium]